MSDKLLEKQREEHGLPGQYNGIADVLEHQKIIEARPKGRDVIDAARRIPGVSITENRDGTFSATAQGVRASTALAHVMDGPRKLQIERAARVRARTLKVTVKNRRGQQVVISPENERQFVQRNLLGTKGTMMMGGGLPRCGGRNASDEDAVHSRREDSGRCEWCGKELPNLA